MSLGKLLIHGYSLSLGSFACPEQYDIFDNENNQVGYVRLRHGTVRCHCPDFGGEIVYESKTIGDGIFVETERLEHLNNIIAKVQEWILRETFKKAHSC